MVSVVYKFMLNELKTFCVAQKLKMESMNVTNFFQNGAPYNRTMIQALKHFVETMLWNIPLFWKVALTKEKMISN